MVASANPPTSSSTVEPTPSAETRAQKVDSVLTDIDTKPKETTPEEKSNVAQQEDSNPLPTSAPSQPAGRKFISGGVETDLATLEKRCKRFGIPFDPSKYVQTNKRNQVKRTRNEANVEV